MSMSVENFSMAETALETVAKSHENLVQKI